MVYLLSIFLFSCWAYLVDKNKIYKLNLIIPIMLIGIIFSFNRQNQDYQAYLEIFKIPESYAEIGYISLVSIVKELGGSHETIVFFLGVLVAITFYRMAILTKLPALLIILYMIFPMPIDVVQIRNTFMVLFFINSLIDFYRSNIIRSSIFIFLCICFHSVGVLYLIFWTSLFFRNKKYFSYVIKIGIVLSFIIVPFAIKALLIYFNTRTLSAYISNDIKWHSIFIWGVPFLFDLFILKLMINKYLYDAERKKLARILYTILMVITLFMPFLLYVDEINRLFRNAVVIKYFLACIVLPSVPKLNRMIFISYLIAFAVIIGIYYVVQINYDYIIFSFPE
ncbi:EpsG family protein [Budviciaceae bacterium BWR-B9]|uniref:EpsG family protein n=1 Tax=Limnobaculum allomyrinae TaxID=2791986 RepID=A0ABS1IUV9_9GAMM|nr:MULTISPECIES: EpsG family protein [Limnobaculum]MBK5145045.1 EpsG family protein [Limnobaculum allomyrinae]MBV7692876.1 EpsG family protein [Limnobaculum sp. M2-1]